MSAHIVQFDKTFLDGNLTGMKIPGQIVRFPDYASAQGYAAFAEKVERENDFVREAVTGNRFRISNVQLFAV